MLIFYSFESLSHGCSWILYRLFSLESLYGFLQGAWPFGLLEAIWSILVFKKWIKQKNFTTRQGGRVCEIEQG